MQEHLQSRSSIIVQRYKFQECKQLEGEDIKTYLAKLKKLLIYFGEQLKIRLRDQFVWGLASEKIRRRLLIEHQLTYAKTVEISTSMELAVREATDIKKVVNSTESELNYMDKKEKRLPVIVTEKIMYRKTIVLRAMHAYGKASHLEIVCKSKESSKEEEDNSQKQKRVNVKTKKVIKSTNNYLEEFVITIMRA